MDLCYQHSIKPYTVYNRKLFQLIMLESVDSSPYQHSRLQTHQLAA